MSSSARPGLPLVGAATSRPQVCAMSCAVRRGALCAPADHCPRCMLHHLGADHLVEAPGQVTEQSGSE